MRFCFRPISSLSLLVLFVQAFGIITTNTTTGAPTYGTSVPDSTTTPTTNLDDVVFSMTDEDLEHELTENPWPVIGMIVDDLEIKLRKLKRIQQHHHQKNDGQPSAAAGSTGSLGSY